ncbi:methyltransferase domain-containing protein [candidate division KSB1 bacterium]|nr:methyltransferase domain-containing protein [candidate division KSB1 bacterium]
MNSKQISQFFGNSVLRRNIGYFLIYITVLWEWYIRSCLLKAVSNKSVKSFLDVGCGMGQHAFAVAQKYPHIQSVGLEVDAEQVADCNTYARKRGLTNITFIVQDLETFIAERKYDVILCSHILEHIHNDLKVISAMYSSLNDKGILIIYVPTSEERVLPWLGRSIHQMVKASGDKYPHQHVRYYTLGELVGKLKRNHFMIKYSKITYGHYGRLAYDIVTSVQYSPFFKLVFPFYLIMIHPIVLVLMWADFKGNNKDGNGLLVVAQKNSYCSESAA